MYKYVCFNSKHLYHLNSYYGMMTESQIFMQMPSKNAEKLIFHHCLSCLCFVTVHWPNFCAWFYGDISHQIYLFWQCVIVIIMCIIIITASHDKGLSPCDEFCCIVYLNRVHYCHVGFVLHDVVVSVSDWVTAWVLVGCLRAHCLTDVVCAECVLL